MSTLSYNGDVTWTVVPEPLERTCVGCGCTDSEACVEEETGRACSWVPDSEMDVCSFCAAIALCMAEADERDVEERSESRIQLYSPHQAQRFIEETRVMRGGA